MVGLFDVISSGSSYKILHWFLEWLDMKAVMPVISRLPLGAAHRCADLRGLLRYHLDCDWRSACLGFPFVKDHTRSVLKKIFGVSDVEQVLRKRFKVQSREELEGFFILNQRTSWPVEHRLSPSGWFDGIPGDRGIVLIGSHFDSSWAGMSFISRYGRPVSAVYDRVVFDPRVFSFFQDYFRKKYQGIIRLYNGGTLLSAEDLRREGAERLGRGEIIVFFADVPRKDRGIPIDFLGKKVLVPFGAFSYAMRTNAFLSVYVTKYLAPGCYQTLLGRPVRTNSGMDIEKLAREAYGFLEDMIMGDPGSWWGADTFAGHCT